MKLIEIEGTEDWVNMTLQKSLVTPETPIFRALSIGTIKLLDVIDLPIGEQILVIDKL